MDHPQWNIGVLLATLLFFILCLPNTVEGRTKRCFVCRSRGDLGDCRDPFMHNFTTVEDTRAVEATPCASGWCAKVVEGKDLDHDIATERRCLQRPPDDNEERCADAFEGRQRVFMCFCRGDLCNTAHLSKGSLWIMILASLCILARS